MEQGQAAQSQLRGGGTLQSRCSLLSEVTGVEVLVVEQGHHEETGVRKDGRGRDSDLELRRD